MFYKEILGIFLGEHSLDYCLLKKRLNKWQRSNLSIYSEPTGKNPFDRLGHLLSQIKPKRGRRISILIPRSRYYIRELKFPNLSPEEAENAVRIAIGIHAHLPPEEIVFDCFSYKKNGISHVLLCYSKKTYIEAILEQLDQNGIKKELYCISPVGLGADLFLRLKQRDFPLLSCHEEDSDIIINIHGSSCWQGSHSLNSLKDVHLVQFNSISKIALFSGLKESPLPNKEVLDPCRDLDIEICRGNQIKLGLLASIVGSSSYPLVSLKPGKRKKPIALRIDTYQVAFIALLVIVFAITLKAFWGLSKLSLEHQKNAQVIAELNKKYEPLKLKEEELKNIQKLEKDLEDFIKERPSLLDILRELSIKTPKNAWIKYMTVRDNKVRVSAEGGYAVETMEAWRKSRLFTEVKLASPVTKNRQGQERYTVELRLKLNQ